MEVADTACDIDVARDRQRNKWNPTEREPWVALLDMCCHVTTVVTLEYHALIFRDFLSEGVLAAHEEEEHCCDSPTGRRGSGVNLQAKVR